jgi:hypothetical protein
MRAYPDLWGLKLMQFGALEKMHADMLHWLSMFPVMKTSVLNSVYEKQILHLCIYRSEDWKNSPHTQFFFL